MIKHFPIVDIKRAIEHYSKKDGVPIEYVCTTDFGISDVPVDIFYRETPHPEFGNKYFGIAATTKNSKYIQWTILNTDKIENFTFGMVEDDDGNFQYSQSHHDFKSFDNGNMIDGGREYIRSSGKVEVYVVRDGKMVERHLTNADSLV